MRDIAIVSVAQVPNVRRAVDLDEVEMVRRGATDDAGIPRDRIGFTCSGSNDLLEGRPFSFVSAVDGIGAWPPISESHVEMDGAWALYEAWVRLQHGDIDAALVYAFGRSSAGPLPDVMTLQLDPYTVTPLWPDAISVAEMQARAMLDARMITEREMAEIAARNRAHARSNPNAHLAGDYDVDALLAEPYISSPLRRHACPPITDGAAAVVIAAGDVARELCARPAWIGGIAHRIESAHLGLRDLTRATSVAQAAEAAGAVGYAADVIELHAPFAHQERLVLDALDTAGTPRVNPSGGAMSSNPMMVAGLLRMAEAAACIHRGDADRAVAHATSGPALQHNMVCTLEARS